MNIANVQYQKMIRKRVKILVLVLALWALGILARLVELQIIEHARLNAQVIAQNQAEIGILPERGTIFDRNGQILAESVPSFTAYFQKAAQEPPEAQAERLLKLASVLGLTANELERARTLLAGRSSLIQVKRKLSAAAAEAVNHFKIKGVLCRPESMRFYPQGSLASHILGGVSADNKGQGGVEYKFDAVLRGRSGRQLILLDARQRTYNFETLEPSEKGGDIILTIDKTIQYLAERELERAVQDCQANWGTVIVSHPATGEILALASWPAFDPNTFPPPLEEAMVNRAVQLIFEPGSTFKIVTASAALENHRVSMAESFDCRKGSIETAGSPIRDHKPFGILTFPDVLVHSSNVGTILIGRRAGAESLLQATKSYGFGEKTGVELPAEAAGLLRALPGWTRRSVDSVSIGYEIAVTPVQILQAMNVIANRGDLVRPRIVKAVEGAAGRLRPSVPDMPRVISEQTARCLIGILERAVAEGTGQPAIVPGYSVAGKTGTTQKFDPASGSFSASRHTASFAGFVPVENPVLSMVIVLDEPKTDEYYGGQVAAPVFREIARRALRYLGIKPRPLLDRPIIAANVERGARP